MIINTVYGGGSGGGSDLTSYALTLAADQTSWSIDLTSLGLVAIILANKEDWLISVDAESLTEYERCGIICTGVDKAQAKVFFKADSAPIKDLSVSLCDLSSTKYKVVDQMINDNTCGGIPLVNLENELGLDSPISLADYIDSLTEDTFVYYSGLQGNNFTTDTVYFVEVEK